MTSANSILYGTNICLQDTIILMAADWFVQLGPTGTRMSSVYIINLEPSERVNEALFVHVEVIASCTQV